MKRRWRAAENTVESIGEAFHVSGRTTRPWVRNTVPTWTFQQIKHLSPTGSICRWNPFIFLPAFSLRPPNNYIQQGSVLRGAWLLFPPPTPSLSPLSRQRSAKSKLSDLIRYSWRGTDICSSSFSPDGLCKSRMEEVSEISKEKQKGTDRRWLILRGGKIARINSPVMIVNRLNRPKYYFIYAMQTWEISWVNKEINRPEGNFKFKIFCLIFSYYFIPPLSRFIRS